MMDIYTTSAAAASMTIAGGFAIGAGIWAIAKAVIRSGKALAKRTRTKHDDVVMEKLGRIVRFLESNPEVVEVLHDVIVPKVK